MIILDYSRLFIFHVYVGVWYTILDIVAKLAVVTNVSTFIIATYYLSKNVE